MKTLISLFVTATIVIVSAQQPERSRSVSDFFDAFLTEWMHLNLNNAALANRFFSGAEQDAIDQQIAQETPARWHMVAALSQKGLRELATFDRDRMTEAERVSADLMAWELRLNIDYDRYYDYFPPLEQFNGVNVKLTTSLTVGHPLNTEKDAVHYLARLGLVGTRMDEAVANSRRLAAIHVIPPRFILRATIAQMQLFVDTPPANNPFVEIFDQKVAASKAVADARREELRVQAETIVVQQVYPAWKRGIALLQSLEPGATDVPGLWRLKGGLGAYSYMLRRYTTTNLTPDEVHAIGLKRVAELELQMDDVLRQIGRTEGSVRSRIDQLKKEQAYPLTDDGRAQIIADAEAIMLDAQKRVAAEFDRLPKAAVVVRAVPRFREANATTGYSQPAPDGSRPGTIQLALRPERMTRFGLRTLLYHEGVPGHHMELGLELENAAQPRFRRLLAFGAIVAPIEGWGLYVERLAVESGWYRDDPIGLLGELDSELFRARRLVVDTGIHAKHWTRQQAIDYGIEPSEVERYVVTPGQACAYMIGELKILELREKARKALGEKFDIRAFHRTVLSAGMVPLSQLESIVDEYIRKTAETGRAQG